MNMHEGLQPNGLTQRGQRVRDVLPILAPFMANRAGFERRNRLPVPRSLRDPLEPMLGAFVDCRNHLSTLGERIDAVFIGLERRNFQKRAIQRGARKRLSSFP
jgi:hypothetical protein